MNRRSFINRVVQGGAVVATGLPEKLLSSEASTVDKIPFKIRMCDSLMHYHCGCPNDVMLNLPSLRITVYDEHNYVYIGGYELNYKMNLDDQFVHKKYFLVALLKDTETKKI